MKTHKRKPSPPIRVYRSVCFKQTRSWAVDYDYLDKLEAMALSDDPAIQEKGLEAILFLNKFNQEYYNSYGLRKPDSLHNTPELIKSCEDAHNSANRCAMNYYYRTGQTLTKGKK